MDVRRVALGIGNPGDEYAATRHNIGFMVLDHVAGQLGVTFRRLERQELDLGGKVKAQLAEGRSPPAGSFLLVKPLTYVNASGGVAGPLLRRFGLGPDSLFVIVDDLDLPLGRLRIRPAGSSGGHNGLRSIEQALGSTEYPRLRLGIGRASASTAVEHVLGPFLPEERELVDPVMARATEAVVAWLAGTSVQRLMDRYNGQGSADLEKDL